MLPRRKLDVEKDLIFRVSFTRIVLKIPSENALFGSHYYFVFY